MRIKVVPYWSVQPELLRSIEAKLQNESCSVSVIASISVAGLTAKRILDVGTDFSQRGVDLKVGEEAGDDAPNMDSII